MSPAKMCAGKAMTEGYLSMTTTQRTPDVAERVTHVTSQALMHGPTYMGNPLAAAVSLASIELLLDERQADTVERIETK